MAAKVTKLTRDFLISSVHPAAPVPFDVPEWGGTIFIEQAKTGKTAHYSELMSKLKDEQVNVATMIAFCVTEDGQPLFTEEDAEWIRNQPVAITNKITAKIMEVNGFSSAVQDSAEENFEKAGS